jgi:hypothetical protein
MVASLMDRKRRQMTSSSQLLPYSWCCFLLCEMIHFDTGCDKHEDVVASARRCRSLPVRGQSCVIVCRKPALIRRCTQPSTTERRCVVARSFCCMKQQSKTDEGSPHARPAAVSVRGKTKGSSQGTGSHVSRLPARIGQSKRKLVFPRGQDLKKQSCIDART